MPHPIAVRIRALRQRAGLSIDDVEKRQPVVAGRLGEIERSDVEPECGDLLVLGRALNATMTELTGRMMIPPMHATQTSSPESFDAMARFVALASS